MKARFNYKSRKTIIVTIAIVALLALSATGVYVFTKGNDNAEAFTENNNTVIDGSSQAGSEENQTTQSDEQTIQPNIDGQNGTTTENNEQGTTENNTQSTTGQGTTNVAGGTTTSTTAPTVPNNEYVTERQEEVERLVAEDYLVGWTPISLAAITSNIELNKDELIPEFEIKKVATLVNGEEIVKDENGKVETKVQKGDKVTYTITIRNTGNVTLQDISISDELINYSETIKVLAIGDEIVKTVEYTVNEQDMNEDEEIVNVVKATVTDPTNPDKTIEKEDEEIVPVNPYITVSGEKTWVDYNNQENTRPKTITVEVLNGTEVVDTITVTAKNGWSYTSKELPKYDAENNVINYTVREQSVDKYTTTVNDKNITNTLNYVPMVTVSGTKTWVDYDNKENTRPETITVEILNGNDVVDTITVTAENGWNYTSKELPKYDAENNVINYTVREQSVDRYTTTVEGTAITNTLNYVPMVTVSGIKTWVDYDNKENTRPETITVEILNGNDVVDTITVTAENGWNYTSKELPKYDAENNVINYTVREQSIDRYTTTISDKNITNTLNYVPMVTVSGTKTWVDYDNKEKTRPETITVEILNGDDVVDTIAVTAKNGWNYTSKELPKYDAENNVINYTVREQSVDKYTTTVSEKNITNTLNYVPMVTVSGTKTWVDYDNKENTRPETITVEVLNGTEIVDTITVTAKNGWNYTSKELPKYDANNNVINYTVREVNVDTKYEAAVNGNNIINTLKETPKTEITVSKVWSDGNNQDANRPTSVKVQLFADGVAQGDVITLTVNNKLQADENIWQYTFTGLDKYNSKNEKINYEVKEVISKGNAIAENGKNGDYTVTYEKDTENKVMTITNSYTPQTTEVIATKEWVDNNNADKVRPGQITIKLYNGNTVVEKDPTVAKNGNTWTYTFKDLPKYAAGELITYTAKELRADGTIVANNAQYNDDYVTTYNGNTITNTLVKPNITVVKTSNKTNAEVEYGAEITYTLTATNSGNKAGNVTIKDTIPTGTELKEGSKIVVKVNGTTTNITKAQLEAGYEIKGVAANNGNATITFTVVVKAYAGEKIENTAYYKTDKDTDFTPTDEIKTNVEDKTTVIPTIAETTEVTTKQRAILVLDVSGSMDNKIKVSGSGWNSKYETKLNLMKNAVNTFLTEFLKNGKNEVMIITYSSEANIACGFTTNKTTAYNSIGNADGGTNIDAGLTLANSQITSDAENTSVILMTDGLPGRYIDNKTGENIRLSDGKSYDTTCGNEAIESAGWIKAKGSKVYSIGFGLDSISNRDGSQDKAKELMQKIASPTTTNSDGTQNKYYYDTYDGDALNKAFKDIVSSITTITNSDPISLKTTQGIVTITKGFKEGQKVEVYTGTYNKDTSKPVAIYTWAEFVALQYTTYSNNTITFNLGKYMKDSNIAANTEVSLRFINE